MNACSRNRHAEPEVHPAVGNPPSILFTLKVPLPPERGPALLPPESRRTFSPVCALGLLEKLKKKKKNTSIFVLFGTSMPAVCLLKTCHFSFHSTH